MSEAPDHPDQADTLLPDIDADAAAPTSLEPSDGVLADFEADEDVVSLIA